MSEDREGPSFLGRAERYARVGVGAVGLAARLGANRLRGGERIDDARALASALGSLKGPMMKLAQMLATIPDAAPADYAQELMRLQSQAPPMGASFVRRRMQAELGADWRARFAEFDVVPAAAASLGQVHKARAHDGRLLACKLQYPDMASAVEADLTQLDVIFSLHRRMGAAIDTRGIAEELGARLREELDYVREAKTTRLYRRMLGDRPEIRVPEVDADLSTARLLTTSWLDGAPLTSFERADIADRNAIATALFTAWWRPFAADGVIHGDPHLGNYSIVADASGRFEALNVFDYGCVRIFPAEIIGAVIELYRATRGDDRDRRVAAYEAWGFRDLSAKTIDALDVWARFLYGPLHDDRVRTIADGVAPGEFGRREIGSVFAALRAEGSALKVPREFVFMDRAAIGLGAAFLRLGAELNFHRLFEDVIADFTVESVAAKQAASLASVGLSAT